MMNIISVSYKSAPLGIRSAFAFSKEDGRSFLSEFKSGHRKAGLPAQCVILSTCNRLEVFFDGEPETAVPLMEEEICRSRSLQPGGARQYFSIYTGERAIVHLIRVACGIDSMVLGEDEILRQVKDAYALAHECGTVGFEFNTVFRMAVTAAKKIKTSTGLSETPVSVGTLAANETFNFLKSKYGGEARGRVLLIGITGKIGNITARNILKKENIEMIATLRRHGHEAAVGMPRSVRTVDFDERYSAIREADVIISATSSPHYTVTAAELESALRRGAARTDKLFIDLAVPPDIDAGILGLPGVRLVNIDRFREISEENNHLKLSLAEAAAAYAAGWKDEIIKELNYHKIIEMLPELEADVGEHGTARLIYSLRKHAGAEETAAVRRWLESYLGDRQA